MPEAERFSLPDIREVDQVGDLADFVELLALAARLEKRFQLHRSIEVVLDRVLAAAGHQDDVVHAGRDRFLDAVLDDRLVDERQHLFGLCFGGRQEPRAEARGGEDGLADGVAHARHRSIGRMRGREVRSIGRMKG